MVEFAGVLIAVLISAFAFILAFVLIILAVGLIANKSMALPSDTGWFADASWRKIIALALGCIVVLCIEIALAINLGFIKDDASLHCGPGTAYHSGYKGHWTCELS